MGRKESRSNVGLDRSNWLAAYKRVVVGVCGSRGVDCRFEFRDREVDDWGRGDVVVNALQLSQSSKERSNVTCSRISCFILQLRYFLADIVAYFLSFCVVGLHITECNTYYRQSFCWIYTTRRVVVFDDAVWNEVSWRVERGGEEWEFVVSQRELSFLVGPK